MSPNEYSTQQQYTGTYQNSRGAKMEGFATPLCKFCGGAHYASRFWYQSIDIITRKDNVQSRGLCRNSFDSLNMASQCTSPGRCKNCGQQHHTLLCEKAPPPNDPSNQLNPSISSFISIKDVTNSEWLYDESPFTFELIETQNYSFLHNTSESHKSLIIRNNEYSTTYSLLNLYLNRIRISVAIDTMNGKTYITKRLVK